MNHQEVLGDGLSRVQCSLRGWGESCCGIRGSVHALLKPSPRRGALGYQVNLASGWAIAVRATQGEGESVC